mmetsp:Transcript_43988/g.61828  ORF Transcript_43988/g.61828 Transcript_43988/m.61828 type:complete len:449 (-) Transcript_43988:44-1390(-)|eukprot:CAMPEP_0201477122 /NCGR_PEP_ID=MMETSP0151_2-20130828/2219_1 /ASSEMBLY_ACC=CAM_ASM_000257 /TAXON_ID=200890 /ORGANISM="Paramoeba atlantica, Strain 621/1 / CCAP 1560/9" /LENGTH=448 /DNA_ID=CAMNT_0047857743 /DNA_START=119 /DNA_END=1465 /DNA_ORIENTATION=+
MADPDMQMEVLPSLESSVLSVSYEGELSSVPTYRIDLDANEQDRWTQLVTEYKQELRAVEQIVDRLIADATGRWAGFVSGFGESLFSTITKIGAVYYGEELKSIARTTNLPLGKLTLLQLVYEAAASCTALISEGPDGRPLHARTMDWEMEFLRPLTVNLEFYRGDEVVFSGPSWVGYVGMLTGVRSGEYSISVNFRISNGTFWDNVKKAISKSWPIGFLVRDILSRTKTYDNAVARLVDSPVIAPTYFMIAGSQPHQGRQITRERDSSEQPLTLSKERRFLIQPNMDHWSSDYRDDIMNSRQRRTLAESLITASLQEKGHLSENDFWTILSQEPIFNGLTVYGAAMSPSKGKCEVRLPGFDGFHEQVPEKGEPTITCSKCNKNYIESLNPRGFCSHSGSWHANVSDCSKLSCAWGLGKRIGYQHWSCCFETNQSSQACKKSPAHTPS